MTIFRISLRACALFKPRLSKENSSLRHHFHTTMANRGEPAMENVRHKNGIIKSQEDRREYRAIEYPNKLRVLLVSDSETERSAAALDVNVGSMNDPEELPGLAHFCEHMLFLGTEKFPEENEYTKYLSEHGGSYNAYTSADHTTYFFSIMPEYLPGALDRFAQFFLKPLFTESATSREVKAVNSEHEKNLPSDSWRLVQLERHMAKDGHAFRKFGTGNIDTLERIPKERNIDVRKALLAFHDRWYSANTMSLVVLGKESLDELETMVKPLFENVVNKDVSPPIWLDHPVGPEQMRVQALIVSIKDLRQITVAFPIPDMHENYKSSPCSYIAHLIGHEGPGSLLSALKERGWCNALYAGDRTPAKGFAQFAVTMDLTLEGLNHTNEIITLIFQYFNTIRAEGPQEWMFEEVKQLRNMEFRFKDKESPINYVSTLASSIREYPSDEVLSGPYLKSEWRPDLIKDVLNLLVPSRVSVAIVSKSFDSVANLEEPWYGTKYSINKIDDGLIKEWENCGLTSELRSPKPNIFIPQNLDLLPLEDPKSKNPTVVYNSDISRIWFKQDDTFLLPKAITKLEIFSPLSYLDPLNTSLNYMYSSLIKDDLNEFSYDALLAGLSWDISSSKYGFVIAVAGYNDKLKLLLEQIIDKFTNFTVNEERFEVLKEIYVRSLRDFDTRAPTSQSFFYMDQVLIDKSWTRAELLDVAPRVTPQALKAFVSGLLSSVHVEGLVYGNVNRAGALALAHGVEEKLKRNGQLLPLKPMQLIRSREVQLEDGSHYLYEARTLINKSSCVCTYFQCGLQNTQNNIELELLSQITKEPFFDTLRTKEQLGYLVWSLVKRTSGVQGLQLVIQSDKHPDFVTTRIDSFLVSLRKLIEDLTDDEFEKHKAALAAVRSEKPKKLKTKFAQFWSEIVAQQYHFDRTEVEVGYLKTITKQQLLEFFDKFVSSSAEKRHRLTVNLVSDAEGGAGSVENDVDGLIQDTKQIRIDDVISFKSAHCLYPLVQPYMEIPGQTKSKL